MLYRGFSSQEELDEQYNLRESVPDFPAYERFYEEQSEKTREQLECQLDVPFGPTLDEHLDIFPAGRSGAPVLVFIHGGYWQPHVLRPRNFRGLVERPVSGRRTRTLST